MDNTRLDKLFAKHDIKPENIVCVSHSGKHTLFHLLDGQEIHSTAMFKEVREYLSPDIFWNIQKGVLVNRHYVVHIDKNAVYTMVNNMSFKGRGRLPSEHSNRRIELEMKKLQEHQ